MTSIPEFTGTGNVTREEKMLDTDHDEQDSGSKAADGHWLEQASSGLRWLNERAWPLAGLALFVPLLYLHNFIHEEQVPLSITSPAIITALPAMFAFLVLFIGVLALFMISPAMVLFTPVRTDRKDRLVDLLPRQCTETDDRPRIHHGVIIAWFVMLAIIGIGFGVLIAAPENLFDEYPRWLLLGVLLLIVLSACAFVLIIKSKALDLELKAISWDFRAKVLLALLPQTLLMSYVMSLAAKIARDEGGSNVVFALCVLAGTAILGIFQLAGARIIASAARPGRSLATAATAGFVTVALLGLYPPTGAHLAGAVLQVTASGARPCAILSWTTDSPPALKPLHGLDDDGHVIDDQSVPLRILTEADGYYLVRKRAENAGSKAIHFVPRSLVSSMASCPKKLGTGAGPAKG